MATKDYGKTAQSGLRLLTKFGQSVTLRRENVGSTFDPVTSAVSGGANTDTTVKAAILPARVDRAMFDESNRTGIISGKVKLCIMEAVNGSFAPSTNDIIIDSQSVKWSAFAVTPIAPAGVDVLYKIGIKRS